MLKQITRSTHKEGFFWFGQYDDVRVRLCGDWCGAIGMEVGDFNFSGTAESIASYVDKWFDDDDKSVPIINGAIAICTMAILHRKLVLKSRKAIA